MKELCIPPYAPILVESTRSIGYSLESAIADLVDNSISAGATSVYIRFSPYNTPYISTMDDGKGMSPDELTIAMRYGSRNPNEVRFGNDLGRFGLGLKTASLSQCRRLTVVSHKEGVFSGRCWDLDVIQERKEWILLSLEQEEIDKLPNMDALKELKSGTIVIWQCFDRIISGEISIERALGDKMDSVRDHLSLVFHRYLSGEVNVKRLKISINQNPLEANDPFLTTNKATVQLPEENINIEGENIAIKPFILPHISKLTPDELKKAGGTEGFRRQQGFYVYRNKRLIIWGTWFRLIRQEELTKLARVRVDIPNSLDHLWTLDIKKSAATPPEIVRQNLKRIIDRIADSSRRVYTFRGRKINSNKLIQSWDRIQERDGVSYKINRSHPVIGTTNSLLDDKGRQLFQSLLGILEDTFPIHSLYADLAGDRRINMEEEDMRNRLRDMAFSMISAAEIITGGRKNLLEQLHLFEPFSKYPEITEEIIKEYEKNE